MPSPRLHRDVPASLLPAWGIYGNDLHGLSHVADPRRGLRFDFTLAAAVLHNHALVPTARAPRRVPNTPAVPSHVRVLAADPRQRYAAWHHPLEAGLDLHLEWTALDDSRHLLRATVHNRTARAQPVLLHWLARLAAPPLFLNDPAPALPGLVDLPPGARWLDALDYTELHWTRPPHTAHLGTDGVFRGEARENHFVNNTGVGWPHFARDPGDRIRWAFTLDAPIPDAVLRLRYRKRHADDPPTTFAARGLGLPADTTLLCDGHAADATTRLATADLALGDLPAGAHHLELTSLGHGWIDLDGFALVPRAELPRLAFRTHAWQLASRLAPGPLPDSTLLHYDAELPAHAYGLAWQGGTVVICSAGFSYVGDAADALRNFTWKLPADGPDRVALATPALLHVPADATLTRDCLLCSGPEPTVRAALADFSSLDTDTALAAGRRHAPTFSNTGLTRLAATLSTNVVYPVWTGGAFIRHHTPGRLWGCVYTWDAGFIGLGFAEFDRPLATTVLDAYLSEPDDEHAAFLHHGTPLPVQAYLFKDLWDRAPDPAFVGARYARLARYHRFLMGRVPGSTCRDLASGLLRTFDYFYNSGGWDDYAPQLHVHRAGLAKRVAPAVNSAHAIRFAKILRQAARLLGRPADIAEWEADIASLGTALQTHAWDADAGVFSYTLHDESLRPVGPLRHESGQNFNLGLDGVSPLLAGICTPAQTERLLELVFTPGRLWTSTGITAIDRRAAYARDDGYWNGTVWMPHQWFLWKTCLDLGRADLAWRIASTALEVWSDEVEATGNCCEHFDCHTRRGGGWPTFGGLSAPILPWHGAYHTPGRLTVGFDTVVLSQTWDATHTNLRARLHSDAARPHTVLVTLSSAPTHATWNGTAIPFHLRRPTCAELHLPPGDGELELAYSH